MNNQHAARHLGRTGATSAVAVPAGRIIAGAAGPVAATATPLATLTVDGTPDAGCPLVITGHTPSGPSDMPIVHDNGTDTSVPPQRRSRSRWAPTPHQGLSLS